MPRTSPTRLKQSQKPSFSLVNPFNLFTRASINNKKPKPDEGPSHPLALITVYEEIIKKLSVRDILNYSHTSRKIHANFLLNQYRLFEPIYNSARTQQISKLRSTYNRIIFDDKYIPLDKQYNILAIRIISTGIFLVPWVVVNEKNKHDKEFSQTTMNMFLGISLVFSALCIMISNGLVLQVLRNHVPIYRAIDDHIKMLSTTEGNFKTNLDAQNSIQTLLNMIAQSPINQEEKPSKALSILKNNPLGT